MIGDLKSEVGPAPCDKKCCSEHQTLFTCAEGLGMRLGGRGGGGTALGTCRRTSKVHHLEALWYVDRTHVCCYLAMCMPPSLGCTVHIAWQSRSAWFVQSSPSGLYPLGLVLSKPYRTDCCHARVENNSWPLANFDHFSKMANQSFDMVHSLCTHGQSNSWRIGKVADHFKFLIFCALHAVSMQSLWKQLKLSQHSVKGLLNALDFDRKLVNLFGQ